MNKPKIAVIRGKFLNKFEMQTFEPLISKYDITAFSSKKPFSSNFSFPVVKLSSPMDLPEGPFKMQILNRIFVDAHYLAGLENKLSGFDIAHSAETYFHYTKQCLDAKRKGKVKKVVVTVWENIPFNNEGIWGRKTFKRRALSQLDHIIAVTQGAKEALLLEGADEKKISVIAPGIDTKIFKPVRKSFSKKEINILFVGRLEKYKGVYEIIFAAKILLRDKDLESYKLKFTFVGRGLELQNLLKLEKRLGIEKFIKHKEVSYNKMVSEYSSADIFVAPSKSTDTWKEQYNMALMEAQACGLAIITTKSGGIFENVGSAGIYVSEVDFKSLAEKIKYLVLNPNIRKRYSDTARERAVALHDVNLVAKKLDYLYKSLLE